MIYPPCPIAAPNTDNQHEKALQDYIDKMSELLLKEHLSERTADGKLKSEYDQARNVARVRTITVLTQLIARRVGYTFAFLREAGLMSTSSDDNVVSLREADLRAVNWSGANLFNAILSGAILFGADLREANLQYAKGITIEELEQQAQSLKGATMLDGSKHP